MIDMSAPDTSLSVSDFDLDIIQEVLTSQKEKFPKPPPPPMELEQMNLGSNHNSAMLVSRGTGPQTALSYSELHPTNMALGSSQRRVVGQVTRTGNNFLEEFLEKPKLVITEQPKERGMRFRYQCEGRSAGSIQGASSTEVTKTLPAIEIQGCTPQIKKAKITVSLVTKDIPHRPHPHSLVGKDCADGVCVVRLNLRSNQRHSFTNLGIQCVRRKELDAALENRRRQKIDPFNTGHSKSIEDIDMNVVRLCFQCELEREDGEKVQLGPVLSNSIYDKKATTTSELKINRLNVVRGPCTGKTEIYLLCDKVQKDDIEIIFSNGNWEAKAEFAQTDVHRQVAIVFKSPPYQEQDISEEVEVNVALRRLSDHMDSEPVKFTYLPHNPDPYEVNRKRKTRAEINFSEFNGCYNLPGSHQFESLPPVECTPSMPSTFQDGDPPQPAQGLEEIHYNNTIFSSQEDFSQDISTISPEDILSLTQLLFSSHSGNMEQVQEFGFENTSSFSGFVQAPADQDPNSNFVHPSMDLNLNVSGDAQEFYNDVQFCQHNSQLANGFLDSLPSDHAGPASQGLHPCDNDGHVQPQVKMENHVDH